MPPQNNNTMRILKKNYLTFDNDGHQREINTISDLSKVYTDASKELKNQDVPGYDAEKLVNGNFVEILMKHHQSEHKKINDPIFKKVSFEKYLEIREIKTDELERLDQMHENYSNKEFLFYEYNDAFFRHINNKPSHSVLKSKLMKQAPKVLKYGLFDMLSFKGNKAIIDVPKKPFEIYVLNQSQIDLIQDVIEFVNVSRKLDLTYDDVKPHVEKYVKHDFRGRPVGLSYDLKDVTFDYNRILTQRL